GRTGMVDRYLRSKTYPWRFKMQEGHGVYDCCEICGKHVKTDGMADDGHVYHRKCVASKERYLGNESPKQLGDEVTYSVAAPGIGTFTYRITRINDKQYWGILISDNTRIQDPSEVI
ncbi:MAG: LIM domain-containing protein, partial [Planctomycetota bacterium]